MIGFYIDILRKVLSIAIIIYQFKHDLGHKIFSVPDNDTKSIGLSTQHPFHKVAVRVILPGIIIHWPFDGLVSEMLQFI